MATIQILPQEKAVVELHNMHAINEVVTLENYYRNNFMPSIIEHFAKTTNECIATKTNPSPELIKTLEYCAKKLNGNTSNGSTIYAKCKIVNTVLYGDICETCIYFPDLPENCTCEHEIETTCTVTVKISRDNAFLRTIKLLFIY